MKVHDIFLEAMRKKSIEPIMSTRDRSVREMNLGPHHIIHRFPVPGGITLEDLMMRNVTQNNSLLERLKGRSDETM